jgi:hypothetical protein
MLSLFKYCMFLFLWAVISAKKGRCETRRLHTSMCVSITHYSCLHCALSNRQPIKKRLMFLPGYGQIAIADWSIIVQCHLLVKWVLASIVEVVEMGSTLKRLHMESNWTNACSRIGPRQARLMSATSANSLGVDTRYAWLVESYESTKPWATIGSRLHQGRQCISPMDAECHGRWSQ